MLEVSVRSILFFSHAVSVQNKFFFVVQQKTKPNSRLDERQVVISLLWQFRLVTIEQRALQYARVRGK